MSTPPKRKRCRVPGCKGVEDCIFSMPTKSPDVRCQWLRNLGMEDKGHTFRTYVCDEHFCKRDFYLGVKSHPEGRNLHLVPGAVPHLKMGGANFHCFLHAGESSVTQIPSQILAEVPEADAETSSAVSRAPLPTNPVSPTITCSNCSTQQEMIEKQKMEIEALKRENISLKQSIEKCFNNDQVSHLSRGSVSEWSKETLVKSYQIRLACGGTGYEFLRDSGLPLPSIRTLQRRMEHLKFLPGILSDVLTSLKEKVELMKSEEKHCCLMLDEVAIAKQFDYDANTGTVLGRPTIPTPIGVYEDVASHALVYMLAGITTRWKQVVGYQFTGLSFDGKAVKSDIDNLIVEAERMGLKVDAVISDMGPQNQAIWKLYGIGVGRHERVRNSCQHPCDPARKLMFHPDGPHILKNLRGHLTNNQTITIPTTFVNKYSLPGNLVTIDHIKSLIEIDEQKELKLAPYLKDACVKLSHYDKMKVGLAVRLMNRDTGAALRFLVQKQLLPQEAIVTAWFVETVHKWFKLVTSRTRSLAISDDKPEKHQETITFLEEVRTLFDNLKIGPGGRWKPVQTGVLLLTTNALQLSEYYIYEKGFSYVCLGRFTQDSLENLFSMIRYVNPVPSPKFFKMALRLISVSQFFKPNRKGNYEIDDGAYLADLLQKRPDLVEEPDEIEFEDLDFANLDELEYDSLYYLAGRTVFQVEKQTKNCPGCVFVMETNQHDPSIAELKGLTSLKAFSAKIKYAKREVFGLLERAELYLRQHESILLKGSLQLQTLIDSFLFAENSNYFDIPPSCPNGHGIKDLLIKHFYRARIHFFLRHVNAQNKAISAASVLGGSRQMGMRQAIDFTHLKD